MAHCTDRRAAEEEASEHDSTVLELSHIYIGSIFFYVVLVSLILIWKCFGRRSKRKWLGHGLL